MGMAVHNQETEVFSLLCPRTPLMSEAPMAAIQQQSPLSLISLGCEVNFRGMRSNRTYPVDRNTGEGTNCQAEGLKGRKQIHC